MKTPHCAYFTSLQQHPCCRIFHTLTLFNWQVLILILGGASICFACQSGNSNGTDTSKTTIPDTPAQGVSSDCGSVRMTEYNSSDRRWCGFDRTNSILPEFVRAGMTVAVAEPYNGSSFGGEPGEACGECWEISTSFATQLVMVHDLCPIEGNPICAGSHFHFDVASEVASAIDGGGWMGEAAVRRVPCPVSGNIHVYITARNQWGYMQIAFFNHRFPIRKVEYRAAQGVQWLPMERCLARWCLKEDKETFAQNGPGGVFRLTSATGEVIESTTALDYGVTEGSNFDTGIQFALTESPQGACVFTPPGDVFIDSWGGIEGVRWEPNTWGNATISVNTDMCANNSGGCLQLSNFEGSGLHITYRHIFPKTTFLNISVELRTPNGQGTVEIAPRSEDARCATPQTVNVTDSWTTATVIIADSCPNSDWIHGLTISRSSGIQTLLIDELRFE